MEQFTRQLRNNRDRLLSKMAILSIGAIATLDAFKKSVPLSEALFVRASHHRLDGAGHFHHTAPC